MDFITVKFFNSIAQAELAKNLLKEHGVGSFVEKGGLRYPGDSGDSSGAILRIAEKDAENAGKILADYGMQGGKNKFRIMENKRTQIIVAVSGGFDPIHIGHVRMFQEAKALGDKLVVIVNNDNWLKKKKGFAFMPEKERKEIIEFIKGVDEVILTSHAPDTDDMSVCRELRELKPDIFANGGDRKQDNVPEVAVCEEIGCAMAFNIGTGGKVQSSSWLIDAARKKAADRKNQQA